MSFSTNELNRILHQPIRTQIMSHLIAHNSADYNSIKKLFNLSDGHMTTHMRELLAYDYVRAEKLSFDNKSKTIYHITDVGRTAFTEYIKILKKIIEFE